MRILILPGTHDCGNLGDVAMLQSALLRLGARWPEAVFSVLTEAPDQLKMHCSAVESVPWAGARGWLRMEALPRLFFPGIRPEIRRRFPCTPARLRWLAGMLSPARGAAVRRFATALFNADLVVMSGCGMIADAFSPAAMRALATLAAAGRGGIPTAMLGQGIGPLEGGELFQRAAKTLPQVGAIFVRERLTTPDVLKRCGVAPEKIFVTGDDTVEMAFNEKRPALGDGIGVNLRLANYSALGDEMVAAMRGPLLEQVRRHQSTLIGIPTQRHETRSDVESLERLVGGQDAGAEQDTPLKIIRRISGCRVVVTASYHAGVFALSQGIPIIGLVKSAYYRDKFQGLAGEFGGGCAVLPADAADFPAKLSAAIDEAWDQAEALRPQLLAAADRQIKAGRAAYDRLPGLLRR